MKKMEEKRKDLDAEKQKKLINKLVSDLSHSDPQLYYRPTIEIAMYLEKYIAGDNDLNADEIILLKKLSHRDIQTILSLQS